MLRLRTFAAIDLTDVRGSEVRAILRQPKRFALLAYLAVARPGSLHRRDSLLALFWPELDDARARHALSQALYFIRRELGATVLVSRGDEEVGVDAARLWCDAVAFEEHLDRGEPENALELYRGNFLQGFHLTHASEFAWWVDETASRLERRASGAARERAAHFEAVGSLAEAAHWVRRALGISPLDEELTRELIRVLDGLGKRTEALRTYRAFAELLQSEIGVAPSSETRALVARIRAGTTSGASALGPDRVRTLDDGEGRSEIQTPDAVAGGALVENGGRKGVAEATASTRAHGIPLRALRRHPRSYGMALTVITVLIAVGLWVGPRDDAVPLDVSKVLVGAFADSTDSPESLRVADLATDRMILSIAESGMMTPIAATSVDPAVTEARVLHASRASARLLSLARRSGAGTIVWFHDDRVGDSLHIRSEILDVASDRAADVVEVRAGAASEPVEALETLAKRVTGALAARLDPRFAEWKTGPEGSPSFDAYMEFVRGVELYLGNDGYRQPEGAIDRFAEASRLDPRFTTPRVWTVLAQHHMGNTEEADSLAAVLAAEPDRLALTDRYVLEHWLAGRQGRRGDALDQMRRAMILSPRGEYMPLAVLAALEAGRPREAVRWMTTADTVAGWASHWGAYDIALASAYHALAEHDEELAPARRARLKAPGNPYLLNSEIVALAAMEHPDLDARLSEILDMELPPYTKGDALCSAAQELVGHGHRVSGAAMLNRCIQWDLERAEAGGDNVRHRLSWSLIFAGRFDEARPYLEALAEARPDNLNVIGPLAVLAAAQGNRGEAQRLVQLIEGHPASDPYWEHRKIYWRAAVAARWGDRRAAVRLLEEVVGESRSFRAFHADLFFESLWNYPPFALLMEPIG